MSVVAAKPSLDYRLEDHQTYVAALEKRGELYKKMLAAEQVLAQAKQEYNQNTSLQRDGQAYLNSGKSPDSPSADSVEKAAYQLEVVKKALFLHEREVETTRDAARAIIGPKLRDQHEKAVVEVVKCLRTLEAAFETERAIRNMASKVMAGPTSFINSALSSLDMGSENNRNGLLYQVLKSLRNSGYRV